MNHLSEISILFVSTVFDHTTLFLTSLSEVFFTSETGNGVAFALALGAVALGVIPEGVLAAIMDVCSIDLEHAFSHAVPQLFASIKRNCRRDDNADRQKATV